MPKWLRRWEGGGAWARRNHILPGVKFKRVSYVKHYMWRVYISGEPCRIWTCQAAHLPVDRHFRSANSLPIVILWWEEDSSSILACNSILIIDISDCLFIIWMFCHNKMLVCGPKMDCLVDWEGTHVCHVLRSNGWYSWNCFNFLYFFYSSSKLPRLFRNRIPCMQLSHAEFPTWQLLFCNTFKRWVLRLDLNATNALRSINRRC